jgi:hypothetical protein
MSAELPQGAVVCFDELGLSNRRDSLELSQVARSLFKPQFRHASANGATADQYDVSILFRQLMDLFRQVGDAIVVQSAVRPRQDARPNLDDKPRHRPCDFLTN